MTVGTTTSESVVRFSAKHHSRSTPESPPIVCKVCGEPLSVIGGGYDGDDFHGGTLGHVRADHKAVPVRVNESDRPFTFCDFCHKVVTDDVQWSIPCNDFECYANGHLFWGSLGDWCACDDCVPLVREGNIAGIVRQYLSQSSQECDDEIQRLMTFLFEQVLTAKTGDPHLFRLAKVEHGPLYETWFNEGIWPTCQCGYDPHDNDVLIRHWESEGFKVVDDHGTLKKVPTRQEIEA